MTCRVYQVVFLVALTAADTLGITLIVQMLIHQH
jgi:hypothetical protein